VRNVDGGGHNPYFAWLVHPFDSHAAQDAPGSQPDHFLRNPGQSQMSAYSDAMSRFTADADAARSALISGDQKGFAAAMGGAGHLIQDSFAHTDREAGNGTISHIQCYVCTGADDDHHHPDFETNGQLSPQAQGSVDATADFLGLINGAGSISSERFHELLQSYENKWFKQNLPQDPD